jgi:hypothetical protein
MGTMKKQCACVENRWRLLSSNSISVERQTEPRISRRVQIIEMASMSKKRMNRNLRSWNNTMTDSQLWASIFGYVYFVRSLTY